MAVLTSFVTGVRLPYTRHDEGGFTMKTQPWELNCGEAFKLDSGSFKSVGEFKLETSVGFRAKTHLFPGFVNLNGLMRGEKVDKTGK